MIAFKRTGMDKRCASSSPFPSLPVLPPIIIVERDRKFLVELNEWISHELSQIDARDAQQYYTVYKQVFSKVSGGT